MTNNRQCSGVTVLVCLFYVTVLCNYMTQWCYGLKCLLSVGLYHDVSPSWYQKFRQWYRV